MRLWLRPGLRTFCTHASNNTRLRAGSRARWHCKVLNGRATLRSDTWSRSVQERRNALKRVSNATGMPLTGDARLILTSETFRFCGGAADTWWLLSLLFLYSLLLHTSVLQRFLFLLLSFCHLYGSFLIQESNYAGLVPTCCGATSEASQKMIALHQI